MGFRNTVPFQDGPDGTVGAGPHFLQVVFLHPGCIGRNGSAFHRHPVFFRCQGRIDGHLVVCIIPVLHPQVVIFRFQVHIGKDQDILDHLPQDPGHFIPVHFHQRGFHLDFISHGNTPFQLQNKHIHICPYDTTVRKKGNIQKIRGQVSDKFMGGEFSGQVGICSPTAGGAGPAPRQPGCVPPTVYAVSNSI